MTAIRTRITDKGIIQEPMGTGETASFVIELSTTLQGSTLTPGGGGGVTIISDGDTISGTYSGNVLCEGTVSVSGELIVLGDMIVRGDFINDGGHEVTIRGDLFAQVINFDKADTATPQSNFTVDGDLIFTQFNFEQCGGVAAQLRVGGDLIGAAGFITSTLEGSGIAETSTSGLNIIVYGDMMIGEVNVDGSYGSTVAAGSGGDIYVYGTTNILYDLNASGGDGLDFPAGAGGDIYAYSDLIIGDDALVRGGNGTNSTAGNGGHIHVTGDCVADELQMYGGDCNSSSSGDRAGSGGELHVDGDCVIKDFLSVAGGYRDGAVTSYGGDLTPPNGGYVWVNGNMTIDGDFSGRGGNVDTTTYAPQHGGIGAQVYIRGNLVCTDDFRAYGGNANTVGNGGAGGTLEVHGLTHIDDELEFFGGYSGGGSGGSGGAINLYANAQLGFVDVAGGDGTNGSGGNGGSLYVEGSITCDQDIQCNGGFCNSTDASHAAGYGGPVDCRGFNGDLQNTYIEIRGGDRIGATTSPANNSSPFGGSFNCYGDATFYELNVNGGVVDTAYPNGQGGDAGDVNIRGSVNCFYISSNGGSAVGSNGGAGGDVDIQGHINASVIQTGGGGADNSSGVGEDAGTNGRHGEIYLRRGANVVTIEAFDGAGVGDPAFAVNRSIRLGGHCFIGTLDIEDRVDTYIQRFEDGLPIPTLLKVDSMPTKTTLNASDGTPTADIFGLIGDSIFITDAGGGWLSITGAAIV